MFGRNHEQQSDARAQALLEYALQSRQITASDHESRKQLLTAGEISESIAGLRAPDSHTAAWTAPIGTPERTWARQLLAIAVQHHALTAQEATLRATWVSNAYLLGDLVKLLDGLVPPTSRDPIDLAPARRRARVSQTDREAAVRILTDAYETGRLDTGEFQDRIRAAETAKTVAELAPLHSDLPDEATIHETRWQGCVPTWPHLRSTRADREHIAARLSAALSDTRITTDEHTERAARAARTSSLSDLNLLVQDLDARPGRADRTRATDRLRAALAEGRIDLNDYDKRIARVLVTTSAGELEALFSDLPVPVPPAPGTPLDRPWSVSAALSMIAITCCCYLFLGLGALVALLSLDGAVAHAAANLEASAALAAAAKADLRNLYTGELAVTGTILLGLALPAYQALRRRYWAWIATVTSSFLVWIGCGTLVGFALADLSDDVDQSQLARLTEESTRMTNHGMNAVLGSSSWIMVMLLVTLVLLPMSFLFLLLRPSRRYFHHDQRKADSAEARYRYQTSRF